MLEEIRSRVQRRRTCPSDAEIAAKITPETVGLARELADRAARLGRGEAGINATEVPGLIDRFRPLTAPERQMLRSLVLDEATSFGATVADVRNIRGEATPERLIGVLSGEVFGLPALPKTAEEAVRMLSSVRLQLFAVEEQARAAAGRLAGLPPKIGNLSDEQQADVSLLNERARLQADAEALTQVAQAFGELRPEGQVMHSPRLKSLLQAPVCADGPTLGELVDDAARGTAQMPLDLVPVVLDKLLDLNAMELKALRRTMVPKKSDEQRFVALGQENPLLGCVTPDNVLQMLAGVGNKRSPVPTTVDAARLGAKDAQATGDASRAERYMALAEQLANVPRNRGLANTAFTFELSARSGMKGVYSYGYELFFERGAADRHTGKREHRAYHAVFLRTVATFNSYTRSGGKSGVEWGVNPPYLYGAIGNPVLGPRAGVYIPLKGNLTFSGNGTIGVGWVFPIPIPGVHVGVNLYVTDPRLLVVGDPILECAVRTTRALKTMAQPVVDAVADWRQRRADKQGRDVVSPLRLRLQESTTADEGRATALPLAAGASVSLGESQQDAKVIIDGRTVALHLLENRAEPASVDVSIGPRALTLHVNGVEHTFEMPVAELENIMVLVGKNDVFVAGEAGGRAVGGSSRNAA